MTAASRPVELWSDLADFEERADGSVVVTARGTLPAYPPRLTQHLDHWASVAPERPFLAERDGGGAWRSLDFAGMRQAARAIGSALLDGEDEDAPPRRLGSARPVMILSGNSLAHAKLAMGCLYAGIPYAPVSTAYSTIAGDHSRLRHIVGLLTPGLVFAETAGPHAAAIRAVLPPDVELVTLDGTAGDVGPRRVTALAALEDAAPSPALDDANARIGAETIAKILFTSGSTGRPKGVINTHGMLTSNQAILLASYPFLGARPPVLCDWLPWSHTFGGNHNVGIALANGGTLCIDAGRPVPGAFATTIANLRDVAPTAYFNVPKGYEELLPALRADQALREKFFSRVSLLFYAAAGITQSVVDAYDALAIETVGERISWMTGLGSTETGPFALGCRPDASEAGMVGLPAIGVTLKLSPVEGKREARIRSPSITPGYWRDPEATATLFDAEGFLCMGDALRLDDPARPQRGFRFDGRISEDFKLSTGTWVSVGPLRARLLAALAPDIRDVVIAGHDRDALAVLAIPADPAIEKDPVATARVAAVFERLAAEATGSASRVTRFAFLTRPLSIDAGELTDKGSINQRAVLARHADLVEALYG